MTGLMFATTRHGARGIAFGMALGLLSAGCALLKSPTELPRTTVDCAFTTRTIHIDGVMEAAWLAAPVIPAFFLPKTGDSPLSATEVRLLWDQEHLYVFFTARDEDIWGYEREGDHFTFYDDVLEVFLKPNPAEEGYCNFEINALQTVYDAYAPRAKMPMERRWRRWDCAGLQTAVQIQGTLNDYHDRDEFWTMELAIPFRSLPPCAGRTPVAGDIWRVLFSRYDYSLYLEAGLELSASAPLSQPAFHETDEYGSLRFVRH